jgi:uncharacterized protein
MTFIEKYQQVIIRIIVAVGILLALFLLTATLGKVKEYRFIGSGIAPTNTITVTGKGSIDRTPDTARISFSVRNESRSVKAAQDAVTTKINTVTKALKDAGIPEKDIKTDSYSSYPQYSYPEVTCMALNCPKPGTPTIRGYEVVHSITVAVKDLEKVETVIGILGSQGVSDMNGPNFGFEDDKAVAREARDLAIEDAKTEAIKLARSLGVHLVRITSFNEQGGGYLADVSLKSQANAPTAPTIPVGNQHIESNVSLVYEIQ